MSDTYQAVWKDERDGRSSRADVEGHLVITVHHHIHHEPEEWLLTCRPRFTQRPLMSKDLPHAKTEAAWFVICFAVLPGVMQ